jgi:hypothetical protein
MIKGLALGDLWDAWGWYHHFQPLGAEWHDLRVTASLQIS